MKKFLIGLLSVSVLALGFHFTSFAASPTAEEAADAAVEEADDQNGYGTDSSENEVITTQSGQQITGETLRIYVNNTSVSSTSVAGAQLARVQDWQAVTLALNAAESISPNATILSMVDLIVPEGTGTAQFELEVPGLVKGMNVYCLHMKQDGSVEFVKVDKVDNGKVTITMTSYSPIAIVVSGTSPKTGFMNYIWVIIAVAIGLAAGCTSFIISRKERK